MIRVQSEVFSNILIDTLPSTVVVGDRVFPISTDFRTGILFDMLINYPEGTEAQKASSAIKLFFSPEDCCTIVHEQTIIEAGEAIVWFYSCGKSIKKQSPSKTNQAKKGIHSRIYDFDVDAPLIYAAFLAQYGIDLQDIEYLHWWKFSAMFAGINECHEIAKIMGYRAVDLNSIKNKTERSRLAKLQAKYALPNNQSTQDKQRVAGSVFGGGLR